MGGGTPRAAIASPARPDHPPHSPSVTPAPPPPHLRPLRHSCAPLRHSCAPLRHSCAGRNHHAPPPPHLRPLSVIPAQAGTTTTTQQSPPSPIHPSPLPGGRLGGGWNAASHHHRPCTPRSPTPLPIRHTRAPSVTPTPLPPHLRPSPSFLRPFPSFLRRQEPPPPPNHPPPSPIHPSPLLGGLLRNARAGGVLGARAVAGRSGARGGAVLGLILA